MCPPSVGQLTGVNRASIQVNRVIFCGIFAVPIEIVPAKPREEMFLSTSVVNCSVKSI